jgi:hypothetical protein
MRAFGVVAPPQRHGVSRRTGNVGRHDGASRFDFTAWSILEVEDLESRIRREVKLAPRSATRSRITGGVIVCMVSRSRYIAAGLSLVAPGAGQIYSGDRPKGVALLCITAGLWTMATLTMAGPAAARSALTMPSLVIVYLFVLIPAVLDGYRAGVGQTAVVAGERLWYVVMMLLAVGPLALPLLWQSRRFSRATKMAWTVAVIIIALLAIYAFVTLGPTLERLLSDPDQLLLGNRNGSLTVSAL